MILPDSVALVFPPPAATPPTNDAAETNDVLLLLDTPPTAPVPAPLDTLKAGIPARPFATVTTAPAELPALLLSATELPAPLTKEATAALDRLALLAALITAAWLADTSSEWCWEADFPPSAAWMNTETSVNQNIPTNLVCGSVSYAHQPQPI